MNSFFKSIRLELFWVISSLLILMLIFFLADINPAVSRLALSWLFFLSGLYFILTFLSFRRKQKIEDELISTKEELYQLKSDTIARQKDIDDYFIHWVHQVKTPLSALQLMTDSSAPINKADLKEQSLAIEGYTQAALAYLKLSHPDTDLVIAPVKLDDIIKPLLRRYRWSFIHNHTQLNYQAIDDQVITDANWTQVMVDQLLNNALKYAKGQSITISYKATDKSLTIADTGIGIHESDIAKIFDKGYSGFNGRLNQQSSGLGLYLVGKISRRLNQPITVKSEPGSGSQFTIHFPSHLTKL
ncbi:sensor histidine kinase [Aerococcus sanguinicola]